MSIKKNKFSLAQYGVAEVGDASRYKERYYVSLCQTYFCGDAIGAGHTDFHSI